MPDKKPLTFEPAMSLLPEQCRGRAGSIPVEQLTSRASAISQAHSDLLYRGSSVCSSASSSSTCLTSISGPGFISHFPDKDRPCLSQSSSRRDKDKKEQDQKDQGSSSDEINSTTSSVSSSNSSTIQKSETRPHYNYTNKSNNMLSVDKISNSSSSSSSSFAVTTGEEAPMLPPRSARRASRLITPIPPKKAASDERPMLPHAAPHQIYLSSEEDPSSSADDFSDFGEEVESGSEKSQKATGRRISREDTARMVAVVFYGKPSIVTLSPRRSISPSSSNGHQTGSSILRTSTEPTLSRPRSVSSTCSIPNFSRPPRSSSMMTAGCERKRPGFLHIDPYAKGNDDTYESARTPKTPTAMLRKTLNLVKKRSKPNLHQSEGQIPHMEQVGEVEEEGNDCRESICLEQPTAPSVSYQDIIKSARRNASMSGPRSGVSTAKSPKNRFRSGLSLGRQRSVRA